MKRFFFSICVNEEAGGIADRMNEGRNVIVMHERLLRRHVAVENNKTNSSNVVVTIVVNEINCNGTIVLIFVESESFWKRASYEV